MDSASDSLLGLATVVRLNFSFFCGGKSCAGSALALAGTTDGRWLAQTASQTTTTTFQHTATMAEDDKAVPDAATMSSDDDQSQSTATTEEVATVESPAAAEEEKDHQDEIFHEAKALELKD